MFEIPMLEQDWPAFFGSIYFQSILSSPLLVIETLSQVQYQKRYTDQDIVVTDDTLIPRLQGDLPDSLKRITEFPSEGTLTLWKAHITYFTFKSLFTVLQPTLEEVLNDAFDVFDDVNPWTQAVSFGITSAFLCPLELVRTRYFQ
jgi:hypothetical protein